MSSLDWRAAVAFDLAHVWHPFTQMKEHTHAPPIPVVGAEGCDLLLSDNRRVFDGVASWWTNLHGHGHPRLVEAAARQAHTLDHAMFAGFTHEPAVTLVERLLPKLPSSLSRVFFSDNGSTSVEVALKMTFQAQWIRGQRARTRIGALRGAYHGDTLGAVGVGELDNFMTALFEPLLLRCDRFTVPADPRRVVGQEGHDVTALLADAARLIDELFDEHGGAMAAFVCEPLVQGAGGMFMWPAELLRTLRRACDRHGVYLVFDEVMTGFGRTGTFFAFEQAGVTPDVLCVSKMLTGGMLPLALTIATDALFDVFWGEPEEQKAFLHGHSYTANPIACAVAAESLALFDEADRLAQVRELAVALRHGWSELATHPALRDVRTLGAIAAARLVDPATGRPFATSERAGLALHQRALERGVLVRPIGDCLYLVPPLATPPERIGEVIYAITRALPSSGT